MLVSAALSLTACATGQTEPPAAVTIDAEKKSVSFGGKIYPNKFNGLLTFPKNHHFIVWKGGRASWNALIEATANDLDVQRALESLGAQAGNNLSLDTWEQRGDKNNPEPDKRVLGTPVDISVKWDGHAPVSAADLFEDESGQGFFFRFGGHAHLIPQWKSGCIVCLESCPGGRVSNDRYTLRDYETGVARFDVKTAEMPPEGTPVIITLTLRLPPK